ncbi:MAG: NBR1-Ig-like domain-containing protein [Anaerolineales bacterium]
MRHLLIIASMVTLLTLAACGAGNADATPTMSVAEIYTAAFHTLSAQQATQLALTPPTSTPSKTPPPTVAPPTLPATAGFGTAPTTVGGGVQSCNSSVFINDVTIPDGTVMAPGHTFTKTWALMNKGTCAWSTSYKLVFIGGEAMGGTSVPLPGAVPSGAQTAISVSLTAPATPGDYTGTWQLQNDTGQSFGVQVTVVIKVSGGSGSTNTPGAATATQAAITATSTP